MRSLLPQLFLVLAAIAVAALTGRGESHAAPQLLIEPAVWQFDRDYPDTLPGDADLPIDTVYVKTHDSTDWMATYDSNPNAISGPDSIRAVIERYAQEGVEVAAWFVPQGLDYGTQIQMAQQVIDSGVTALYADLEPFAGFCYLDCRALADNFWIPLRQSRPDARLGVIYDPRSWWWDQSATSQWLSVADAALPMCYWEDFIGQVPWMDPAGCVTQARADLKTLAPGRQLDYIPMLQGDSTPDRMEQALDAAVRSESTRISLWRRGVTPQNVWDSISVYNEPDGPHCALNLVDGCLVREASQPEVYLIQGGAKFWIPDQATLIGMGFDARDVQVLPLGKTHDIPDVPPDGTLLSEYGSGALSVVYGGARFDIAGADQLPALGLDPGSAKVIPTGGLAQVPLIPGDYARLKEPSDPTEYVTFHGARIPLDADGLAALIAGGRNGGTGLVPDGSLARIPIAEVKRGDADCDNNVSVIDVALVLQRSISVPQAGLCTHISGDVTCDGFPMATDALLILRFASGDSVETPSGCPPIGAAEPASLATPPGQPAAESPTVTPLPTDAPPAPTDVTPASDSPTPSVTPDESPTESPTEAPTASPSPTVEPPGTPTPSPATT